MTFPFIFCANSSKLKDRRFNALKAYMDSGEIKGLEEVFDIVPKSVFVKEAGINFVRLTSKINNPSKFTVKDIQLLSQLINIDSRKLYDLIIRAIERKSPGRRKE